MSSSLLHSLLSSFLLLSKLHSDGVFVEQMLLMKRGGQVIYMGALGRQSHKLVEYFEVTITFSESWYIIMFVGIKYLQLTSYFMHDSV